MQSFGERAFRAHFYHRHVLEAGSIELINFEEARILMVRK